MQDDLIVLDKNIQNLIARNRLYSDEELITRKRTRANGEGSIRKRADGQFEGRYTAGYTSEGKLVRKSIYAETRKDCNDKMQKALSDVQYSNPIIASVRPKLNEWLNVWLKDYRADLGVITRKRYASFIKKLEDFLVSNKRLNEILPLELQQYINTFVSHDLSKRAVSMLNAALQAAVDNGHIMRNPAVALRIPVISPNAKFEDNKKAFTLSEETAFIQAIQNNPYRNAYYVSLYAGLRRGEATALTWNKIDMDKRLIYVSEAASRNAQKGYSVGKTKTSSSIRTVPLSETLYNILCEANKDSNFICPNKNGEMLNADILTMDFAAIMKSLNINHTLHHLRHTFATNCTKKGINIKVVQLWMGHANTDMTLNTYTHATEDMINAELIKLSIK